MVTSILEKGISNEVAINGNRERVILWREEDIKEAIQLLEQQLLPNDPNPTEIQLEKKLIFLLKKESEYVQQMGYPGNLKVWISCVEADGCYLDVACMYTLVCYLNRGITGFTSASQLVFLLYKPSEDEEYVLFP